MAPALVSLDPKVRVPRALALIVALGCAAGTSSSASNKVAWSLPWSDEFDGAAGAAGVVR